MALSRIRGGSEPALALAWIDISTGVFRLAETAESRLLADILRIEPRELILADTLFHDPDMRPVFDVLGRVAVPQPAVLFDSATAENRITRYYGVKTLDGFGSFSRAELAAACRSDRLCRKDPDLPSVRRWVCPSARAAPPPCSSIRQRAPISNWCKTLSGDRNGSLLKALDRTVTGGGARLLAERLMSPLTEPERINARLDSIAMLTDQPSLLRRPARRPEARPGHAARAVAAGARARRPARSRQLS